MDFIKLNMDLQNLDMYIIKLNMDLQNLDINM